MEWINQIQLWDRYWLPVIPTNDVNLIPTFHSKNAFMDRGRKITPEEFASGAKVCMVSDIVALGGVRVGDKINLSMKMALYGYQPNDMDTFEFSCGYIPFKPLDTQGRPLKTFFEDEYEVVGIYRQVYPNTGELYGEAVIVPTKSITASDENNIVYYSPMNSWSTSFRIENGKIAKFNTALHNAVPEASQLEIVYDDNGYEEIMQSLKNARLSAALLLAVGALAAVVLGSWAMGNVEFEEERPPAAETSSGAELEVGDISVSGPEENIETAYFSRDYSLWAENKNSEADILLDETALAVQKALYFAAPGVVFLCVALLALVMVNGSLKIEPILLLGGQNE